MGERVIHKTMQRGVFLDRDGTINREIGYLYKIEDFEFLPGVPEAIRLLNENGYQVVVVTNQAGIARGYYRENDVVLLHDYINGELQKAGARIDAFYFCPHHPTAGQGPYRTDCDCRKPKPGMILKAGNDLGIDPARSFMIGDKNDDLLAGRLAGCSPILVKTGYGRLQNPLDFEVRQADTLLAAVKDIILR